MFEEERQILKALANGVNYFTGEKCENDSILNDTNIVRALYSVCDILENITVRKSSVAEFVCPRDIMEHFEYEDEMNLTSLINKIATMYPNLKKLKFNYITELLIQKGVLEKSRGKDGAIRTIATELGKDFGIYNVKRSSVYGKIYNVVIYNKIGQQHVLTILKEQSQSQ